MKTAVFSTKEYDRESFEGINKRFGHELKFFKPHLSKETMLLAHGFPAVCAFVNDSLDADVLEDLSAHGTKLIALRCSGFNQVQIAKAHELGMTILRVPSYSPQGVAEHAVALIMALNRKIHVAHNRVRDGNFSLEGLIGFEIAGKTVGVIGTGQIGRRCIGGNYRRAAVYRISPIAGGGGVRGKCDSFGRSGFGHLG